MLIFNNCLDDDKYCFKKYMKLLTANVINITKIKTKDIFHIIKIKSTAIYKYLIYKIFYFL
jgi:hypothetical protein